MSKLSAQFALGTVCFLLGVLLVSHLRAQDQVAADGRAQSMQSQLTLVGGLVESNARLREDAARLESQLRALEQGDGPDPAGLRAELERLRVLNGSSAAHGPGVRVTLDAELESYWLQDLINELRNAGAEGMTINGRRILAASVVTGSARELRLDGHLLSRPYTVEAVGQPDMLFTALGRPGGLVLQARARYGPAAAIVARQPDLRLPAHTAGASTQLITSAP